MRGQSKRQSLIETWVNIGIGYTINIVANAMILPLFNIHITLGENLLIGVAFTGISLVRGYYVRRMFNWVHVKQGQG